MRKSFSKIAFNNMKKRKIKRRQMIPQKNAHMISRLIVGIGLRTYFASGAVMLFMKSKKTGMESRVRNRKNHENMGNHKKISFQANNL